MGGATAVRLDVGTERIDVADARSSRSNDGTSLG
jgi:hypothetical protein